MPIYQLIHPTTGAVWRSDQRGRRPAWVMELIAGGAKATEIGASPAPEATPSPEVAPEAAVRTTPHPAQSTTATPTNDPSDPGPAGRVVVNPLTGEVWRAGKRGRRPGWVDAILRGAPLAADAPPAAATPPEEQEAPAPPPGWTPLLETPPETSPETPPETPPTRGRRQRVPAEPSAPVPVADASAPATTSNDPIPRSYVGPEAGPHPSPWLGDLLTEPVFRVRYNGERLRRSLPALLRDMATLDADDVEPVGLRPHQTHAWHGFVVQLMALAEQRHGGPLELVSEADWQRRLLDMVGGSADAWRLVVQDMRAPGFLQCPAADVESWKTKATPDEIDLAFTGRNWEAKAETMQFAHSDQWAYALITNATCNGFSGPGYQQASRMNGAYGTRLGVGLAPTQGGWPAHIRRDVRVLVAAHDAVAAAHGYAPRDGIALTWTLPWNGKPGTSLPLKQLDPWFIENARIVRLDADAHGRITARASGSKVLRIDAKALAGVIGDPWLPILSTVEDETEASQAEEGGESDPSTPAAGTWKSMGLRESGFSLRLLLTLFNDGACRLPIAALPSAADPDDLVLIGRGIGRGQGKTLGIHEVVLPLTPAFRTALTDADGRAHIGRQARALLEDLALIRTKGVFPAASRLLRADGGPVDPRVDVATTAYEIRARDAILGLLPEFLAGGDEQRPRWRAIIAEVATATIDAACDRCVLGGRRLAGIAAATGILDAALRPWRQPATPPTPPIEEPAHA